MLYLNEPLRDHCPVRLINNPDCCLRVFLRQPVSGKRQVSHLRIIVHPYIRTVAAIQGCPGDREFSLRCSHLLKS